MALVLFCCVLAISTDYSYTVQHITSWAFCKKMAVFMEKSPVTCSNCYKTIKTASILIKHCTNVDWITAFVTTCSGLNFLLPWQWGDISKLPKITILCEFFPSKLISKCCYFSMDWDRVKCFSALVTHYIMINLGSILASNNSKIFLSMRGTTTPLQTSQTESPSGNPLM
jgi:hypothetical protein